jgi:FdhE protein
MAAAHGVSADALDAIVRLLGIPLLMTWAGQHAAAGSWIEPYCPVCGAWPAFVEVRGIERRRFYRCGRCGCQWHAQQLRCPFCSTTNHEELATLAPADPAATVSVDACQHCRGYMKSLTRLQGCRPGAVILEDLATVDVDVAAMENGYARPAGLGHPLVVRVLSVDERTTRR